MRGESSDAKVKADYSALDGVRAGMAHTPMTVVAELSWCSTDRD